MDAGSKITKHSDGKNIHLYYIIFVLMLENLNKYTILLASKSPRRRELLEMLRIPFKVVTLGGIKEIYPEDMPASEVPVYLSSLKADAYLKNLTDKELLITADTLVIMNNKIFGKPKDGEEALEMLLTLSDNIHQVVSGVTIACSKKRTCFSTVTDVKFNHISEDEARYYIENFRPFDKAGAYGIQEWIGAVAVKWIKGSYYNVMGLPVHKLFQELQSF